MFIITERIKRKVGDPGEEVEGVGVMKEEEIKPEEIEDSHTLGGSGRYYTDVIHKYISLTDVHILDRLCQVVL